MFAAIVKKYEIPMFDSIVNVNYRNLSGVTALIWACMHARDDIVESLLKIEGIDVNIVDYHGKTALMYSCIVDSTLRGKYFSGQRFANRKSMCVKMLLNTNINVNIVDNDGNTALMYACMYEWGVIDAYEITKHPDIDVSIVNKDGYNALLIATKHRNNRLVSHLLSINPDTMYICTNDGTTIFKLINYQDHKMLSSIKYKFDPRKIIYSNIDWYSNITYIEDTELKNNMLACIKLQYIRQNISTNTLSKDLFEYMSIFVCSAQ